jgi:PAS domain S-box-containing protein
MNSRMVVAPPENGFAQRGRFTELDLLYRRSPIGLAILDRELRFLHVNEALAEFHGISAEDLIGRPAQELTPNLGENFAAVSKCAREENAPFLNFEFGLKSASAPFRLRHFLAQLYSLEITNGNACAGLAMVEITERKLAEETLRRSEARYRDIVEHSVYGVGIVTSAGAATETNATMLRILGCSSQEEAASINFVQDVFRYSDQQAQLFATCRQQGSLQNAEAEWRRRDGGIVSMRLHLRRLAEADDAEAAGSRSPGRRRQAPQTRSAKLSAMPRQHRKSRAVAASRR